VSYERLHVTFVGIVATLVDSVVVAEFAGYWLHRLLHSDKFPAPSRANWKGYRTAIGRYGLEDAELFSLRACSKGLFQKENSK
jgi:hypothetical protein